MKNHDMGDRFTVGLALAALSALVGCGEDQRGTDEIIGGGDGVAAQELEPPHNAGELSGDNIKIESIDATGLGCPSGSWDAQIVPEGNAFTLTFESYVIEAPPSATPVIQPLACDLTLKVRTPLNLAYAVTSFQYFGYANLAPGMKASLLANYAFTGVGVSDIERQFRYDFPVPYETTYAINDDLVARGVPLTWAPCNMTSSLQVRTRLTLESANPERPGILAMDNIDFRSQAALRIDFSTGSCTR